MEHEVSITKKRYTQSFALDKAKLSRILDIAEDKFAGRAEAMQTKYEVDFEKGRNATLASLEDVLRLDNTIRNPITSFTIIITGQLERILLSFDDRSRHNINLTVVSQDAKWANQTFAEIEEQVERTFLDNWIYRLRKSKVSPELSGLFAMLTAMVTTVALFTSLSANLAKDDSAQTLSHQAQDANTVEEKIDFLFEMHKMELDDSRRGDIDLSELTQDMTNIISLKFLFLFLPILIILGCLVYLTKYCYPGAVFLWGDCLDWYENITARRRTIWTVVVASLMLGILSNLFVFGLSEFL